MHTGNGQMNELELMRTLVRVVERGNLSAVARETGMGQPAVSRRLKDLEDHLGVVLIQRTTRHLQPTEAGALYYEKAKSILASVEEAHDSVGDVKTGASGVVRISCTSAFGLMYASPALFEFQTEHPYVTVSLSLSDRRIDLIEDGIDIAIRLGALEDSGLIARKIGLCRRIFVAAPEYLEIAGKPEKLSDLSVHNGLFFHDTQFAAPIEAVGPNGRTATVDLHGKFIADHAFALRDGFLAGRGLGPAHEWLVAELIQSGRLVKILPDYELADAPLTLLSPPGRMHVARVRMVADYLVKAFRNVHGVL